MQYPFFRHRNKTISSLYSEMDPKVATPQFTRGYNFMGDFINLIKSAFEIEERKTSIWAEWFAGYIHFISCLFILPVIPNQLAAAGYDKTKSIEATALASAMGCIFGSYVTNLPFIIAPPTAVSIYLAVSLQQYDMSPQEGDAAVVLSGIVLVIIGVVKPVSALVTRLIPDCIQASTAVGIGLITALAGAIELGLVVSGKYTLVQMGEISPAIIIAACGIIIIALTSHYHYKGSFMMGLVFGTLVWWWFEDRWPTEYSSIPQFSFDSDLDMTKRVARLLVNLIFLYTLTLNGIAKSMSDLACLTNLDNSVPRGNWLFIICGLATIVSGYLSGPPILISPESAGGIKAGGKTGMSTLVCGCLFLFSLFFCPLFSVVPPAGTSPLLILIGMTLFMNTSRIRWNHTPESIPAFIVLLLIPFTYSIICGIGFGYVFYIAIGLFTGELWQHMCRFWNEFRGVPYQPVDSSSLLVDKYPTTTTGGPPISNFPPPLDGYDEMRCNDEIFSESALPHRFSRFSNTRARTGSIVDRLSMDLTSGIHSMQA